MEEVVGFEDSALAESGENTAPQTTMN